MIPIADPRSFNPSSETHRAYKHATSKNIIQKWWKQRGLLKEQNEECGPWREPYYCLTKCKTYGKLMYQPYTVQIYHFAFD